MIEPTKKPHSEKPADLEKFKDDEIAPKGRTKHIVETDWPTKEATTPVKKRKIKKTETARLP